MHWPEWGVASISRNSAFISSAVSRRPDRTEPWQDPQTIAAGLRVPAPLGGPVILRALKETGGTAVAVSDDALAAAERRMAAMEGVDACPEGGATLAALESLLAEGHIRRDESVVLFNTGAGWLYRRN